MEWKKCLLAKLPILSDLKMPNPFADLEQKLLNPLFQAADIQPQHAQTLLETWEKIIIAEATMKAIKAMPQSDSQALIEKIKNLSTNEEKIKVFNEGVSASDAAMQAVDKYFKEELPETLKRLANCFTDNATPEQKAKLKELLQQENPEITQKAKNQ